jgi:hypothetical protein
MRQQNLDFREGLSCLGGAVMPTAEQCNTYATECRRLGGEADISIQRALRLWAFR